MAVVRNKGVLGVSQAWVIPGETIKGLLRNAAYVLCVDAARQHGELKVNLQDFYNQTAGGVSFAGGDRELGSDAAIRATQPLLSLFGAANPILCGRIIVHHAISHDVIGEMPDAVLPSGARRDALISTPALADILDSPTSPTEGVGRRQAAEIPGMELQRSALQGMSAHATSRLFRAVIFGGG